MVDAPTFGALKPVTAETPEIYSAADFTDKIPVLYPVFYTDIRIREQDHTNNCAAQEIANVQCMTF